MRHSLIWCVVLVLTVLTSGCGRGPDTTDPSGESPTAAVPKSPPGPEKEIKIDLGGGVMMEFVLIQPGEFMMGSPEDEEAREDSEGPQHRVRITRPFYLGKYEVTQDEYEQVMGRNPSQFKDVGGRAPVEMVSWKDAQKFCKRLSALPAEKAAGRRYRLPTEAEWEYACRAGSPTRWCFGNLTRTLPEYAWFAESTGETTHPVGQKKPNAWGLYDMHGNAWEWCADWYSDTYYATSPTDDPTGPASASGSSRVCRGGSSWESAGRCRSALRHRTPPDGRIINQGFRVVLVPAGSSESPAADGGERVTPEMSSQQEPKPAPARPKAARPAITAASLDEAAARNLQRTEADRSGIPMEQANSIGMKLKLIPPGEFVMGSPENEEGRAGREGPRHRVRITKPFYLGVHEVTVGQFGEFVAARGYKTEVERDGEGAYGWNQAKSKGEKGPKYNWRNPGFAQEKNHPVTCVSWNDALEFCKWLSKKEGREYRLPTEAQWEYACRAGTTTRFYCGDDENSLLSAGNVADATLRQKHEKAHWTLKGKDGYAFTAPAGRFRPNNFGLYDIHGNVWEWCQDWYGEDYYGASPTDDPPGPASGSDRVVRGGSFFNRTKGCRSANRRRNPPKYRDAALGFRVALVPADSSAMSKGTTPPARSVPKATAASNPTDGLPIKQKVSSWSPDGKRIGARGKDVPASTTKALEQIMGIDLELPVPKKRLPVKWATNKSGYDPEQVRQIEAFDPENRIPKSWDYPRSCYLPIIQAARKARLAGKRTDFSYQGKSYRIKYVSGHYGENQIWGKDEELVYVTGNVGLGSVTIYPGTIILVTANQNDNGRFQGDASNKDPLERPEYRKTHASINLGKNPIVLGTTAYPIIFTSDADQPTYADWAGCGGSKGGILKNTILEYASWLYMFIPGPGNCLFYDNISRNTMMGQLHTNCISTRDVPLRSIYVGNFMENAGAETISMNSTIPSVGLGNISINSNVGPAFMGRGLLYFNHNSRNGAEFVCCDANGVFGTIIAHYNNIFHSLSISHLIGKATYGEYDSFYGASAADRDPGIVYAFHGGEHFCENNYYGGLTENTLRQLIQDVEYFPTDVHPWSKARIHWKPALQNPVVLPSNQAIAEIIRRYWTTAETDLQTLDKILMRDIPVPAN